MIPVVMACALGCGGKSQTAGSADMSNGIDGPVIIGQHGTVIDYFTGNALAGFAVTDGNQSTTTDAGGNWTLPAPVGAALAPVVTGPSYSNLFLPGATAAGVDVDWGPIPIPSSNTFMLEQNLVKADSTKALVQTTIVKTGSCTSVAGGTLTVNSPAGTSVAYFNTQGLPTATSFADVTLHRPVAVVFNLPPGANLDVTIQHPTCAQLPPGTTVHGATLTGQVKTLATEPGDNNSSLVIAVQ
jgi:hypothetical protein